MGQASFVNSFPLSLAVRLNFLLLPAELGAGWKFPASGPTGRPWGPEYPAQPNRLPPSFVCERVQRIMQRAEARPGTRGSSKTAFLMRSHRVETSDRRDRP